MGALDEKDSKYVIGKERHFADPTKGKRVSNGSNGASAEHVEVVESPKPKFTQRAILHYRRWWCLYVVGVIVFLAIFLPVFFLVAIPAIAQRMVEDSDLPIHSAMLMNPTPTTIQYSLTASLKVPPPFTVRLEPITLNLYQAGSDPEKPYTQIRLPEYRLKGNSTISVENQVVEILDVAQFTEFLDYAVNNEKFSLAAKGSTMAHLGALKAKLTLDKVLAQSGLNKLGGYSIESARLLFPPPEDGALMAGVLSIPNSSKVTFEMGNVTLNLRIGGFVIGRARLYDVLLKPGRNSVDARIDADLAGTLRNLPAILKSQAEPLRRGAIELSCNGNSTIYNGQHIKYFEDVLNKLEMMAEVQIMKVIMDSLGGMLSDNSGMLGDLLGNLNITDILGTLGGTGLDINRVIGSSTK